jgi:hypothetical protein
MGNPHSVEVYSHLEVQQGGNGVKDQICPGWGYYCSGRPPGTSSP